MVPFYLFSMAPPPLHIEIQSCEVSLNPLRSQSLSSKLVDITIDSFAVWNEKIIVKVHIVNVGNHQGAQVNGIQFTLKLVHVFLDSHGDWRQFYKRSPIIITWQMMMRQMALDLVKKIHPLESNLCCSH